MPIDRNLPIPEIKIEMQEMKLAIMRKLNACHSEISREVEKQMELAIEFFPFDTAVGKATNEAIQDAINSYFSYGGLGQQVIEDAINQAFDKMFRKD